MFSTALTGRPKRKAAFSQYCWKRCAVGTADDYDVATSKREWEFALMKGDVLGLQSSEVRDTMVLCPWNNTEYLKSGSLLGLHLARMPSIAMNGPATTMEDEGVR